MKYDFIVIGGGVIGTAVLDRLAAYSTKALLLEKEDDVATFTTRANSGIVHAGYDCEPNTLKARFNVRGNELMWQDVEDLDVPHLKCGSLVVARYDQLSELEKLAHKALANNVFIRMCDRETTLEIEPNISNEVVYSLYAPSAGIVSPYQLAIAYADRSIKNGAKIRLNAEVTAIKRVADGYKLSTTAGNFTCGCIINCAGAHGADINDLAGAEHFNTAYRRGDYFVLDNTERKNVHTVIFPTPSKAGKGILVAPTADGNVIYGPTAVDTESADDTATSLASLDEIRKNVPATYKPAAFNKCIRVYGGVRTIIGHDFVVQPSDMLDNYYMAIGICSPGLTSAPAIAEYIEEQLVSKYALQKKEKFIKVMPRHKRLDNLSENELDKLIAKDSAWGRIVCRCEKVTEAEIVKAIHSPLPATTVDAVKRRTRAGMGRCQGGFCGPKVMEIISRELKIPLNEVKKGGGASVAQYKVKEVDNNADA